MNSAHRTFRIFIILFFIGVLFFLNLFFGSIAIPYSVVKDILLRRAVHFSVWSDIVLQSRFPQAVTALFSGAALAVSGLMLQVLFKNPLSGPDILGISSGAHLGVAILLLYFRELREISVIKSIFSSVIVHLSTVMAAFIGALMVLIVILFFSIKVKSTMLLLVIGVMIGYFVSSGTSVLYSFTSPENLKLCVLWGLGSFSVVSPNYLPFFCICITMGLLASTLLIKPLNILLLGENYAINLGINIKQIRIAILIITCFLTAVVTAFCGPISFIGLVIPHVARFFLGTSNQQFLFFATLFLGSAIALFCNWVTVIPFWNNHLFPLNAVTSLTGAPIIIYLIAKKTDSC